MMHGTTNTLRHVQRCQSAYSSYCKIYISTYVPCQNGQLFHNTTVGDSHRFRPSCEGHWKVWKLEDKNYQILDCGGTAFTLPILQGEADWYSSAQLCNFTFSQISYLHSAWWGFSAARLNFFLFSSVRTFFYDFINFLFNSLHLCRGFLHLPLHPFSQPVIPLIFPHSISLKEFR